MSFQNAGSTDVKLILAKHNVFYPHLFLLNIVYGNFATDALPGLPILYGSNFSGYKVFVGLCRAAGWLRQHGTEVCG